VPIILAPMGSATSAEFAAVASNQGALGSIGSLFRTTAAIKRDINEVRELTNRHYAVNHIPPTLDAEAFRYTLKARPAVTVPSPAVFDSDLSTSSWPGLSRPSTSLI
jgi:NAD(P)H-dependent flavin oxidoreductase YrpB (nitropropane dioxygenase family)